MSLTIEIACPKPPPTLAQLQEGDDNLAALTVSRGEEARQRWPTEPAFFYHEMVSCRSVEVGHNEGRLSVTIRAMSSAGDRDIALLLARSCVRFAGVHVVTVDEGPPITPRRLEEMLGPDWLEHEQESGARTTIRLVGRSGTMSLPGAIRPWYVGRRVLEEFERSSDRRPLHTRMIERMQKVQWIDRTDGYRAAAQFVDHAPTGKHTLAVWQPTVRSLIPEARLIVLNKEPDAVVVIPHAHFVELCGDHLTWLDESQTLVESFPESEVETLLVRAATYDQQDQLRSPPEVPPPKPARKGWKFW